jgi:NadR type nicotinamide-nucleotide adenylyltransferase
MKRGIVIGKFYPPHKGHKYLIEQGCSHVDKLTVIVCDHKSQKIPGKLRAAWIKEMVPAVKILVVADCIPENDSKGWADYTIKILGYVPDVVFTSEDYGDAYAHFMGAKHIQVDKERKTVPIAARQIRSNPLEHWGYLEPCVRAYFAKKVCVVGAESSGTTTMAKALAEYYKTVWVPEFGREYTETKLLEGEVKWKTEDFILIAQQQNKIEDECARQCNKILICDTDSFATSLWHERYIGFISSQVEALSAGRHYDIYFLTDVDIPFVQDGTRDGEHIRLNMHKRFEGELRKRNKPYILLSGNHELRLKKAIEVCNQIIAQLGSYF